MSSDTYRPQSVLHNENNCQPPVPDSSARAISNQPMANPSDPPPHVRYYIDSNLDGAEFALCYTFIGRCASVMAGSRWVAEAYILSTHSLLN